MAGARAYGAAGMRARDAKSLEAAIRAALETQGPTLIEVLDTDFLNASTPGRTA